MGFLTCTLEAHVKKGFTAFAKVETLLAWSSFFVRTDHCSLKYLLDQRVTTNEQQRLLMKILPFDFTIVYKAGKENVGADSLSRIPQHADFLALAVPIPLDFANWTELLQDDPYTRDIMISIHSDPSSQPDFHVADNKLFYKE
ncbi:hypothetical protein Tco_1441839, partial [Tanacetum coccineum]